jgi:hypothetical protein
LARVKVGKNESIGVEEKSSKGDLVCEGNSETAEGRGGGERKRKDVVFDR